MAAGGYPGDYRTGDVIHGLPLEEVAEGKVFHAGLKLADNEQVVTSGGRVLCVTALGHTVAEAQKRAYALMTDIHWDDCFCRKDIGSAGKILAGALSNASRTNATVLPIAFCA